MSIEPRNITNQTAARFVRALGAIEQLRDIRPMVDLFSEECELRNFAFPWPLKGRDGAVRFWKEYLLAFDEIQTEFTYESEAPNCVTLEWTSRGRLRSGRQIHYRGVSVLELEDNRITSFRAYYDSAALAPVTKTTAA